MATRNELFPSKYLKAGDLQAAQVAVTIASLEIEEVGMDKEEKPVLHFNSTKKAMVLNLTNYNSIAEMFGEETDQWTGKQIVLFPTVTQFGNKMVDAIRIKPVEITTVATPAPAITAEPEPAHELDDAIPF